MIDTGLLDAVAARFRILGDPGRLLILSALAGGERSVGDLAGETGRPQPNVSQHLGRLVGAGLVTSRREGNQAYYRLTDPYLRDICQVVCDSLRAQARRERSRLERMAMAPPVRRPRRGGPS